MTPLRQQLPRSRVKWAPWHGLRTLNHFARCDPTTRRVGTTSSCACPLFLQFVFALMSLFLHDCFAFCMFCLFCMFHLSTGVNVWCFLALRTRVNVFVRVSDHDKTTTCQWDDNNTTDSDSEMATTTSTQRDVLVGTLKTFPRVRGPTQHDTTAPPHHSANNTTPHPQAHNSLSLSLSSFLFLVPRRSRLVANAHIPTIHPSLRPQGLDTRNLHACWTPWSVLLCWCCWCCWCC